MAGPRLTANSSLRILRKRRGFMSTRAMKRQAIRRRPALSFERTDLNFGQQFALLTAGKGSLIMPDNHINVFVSSTRYDLPDYRRAVLKVLKTLNLQPRGAE